MHHLCSMNTPENFPSQQIEPASSLGNECMGDCYLDTTDDEQSSVDDENNDTSFTVPQIQAVHNSDKLGKETEKIGKDNQEHGDSSERKDTYLRESPEYDDDNESKYIHLTDFSRQTSVVENDVYELDSSTVSKLNQILQQKEETDAAPNSIHQQNLGAKHRQNSGAICQKKSSANQTGGPKKRKNNNYNRTTLICEMCGKCTKRKSDLTKHMRIHTGERPFHCEYCHKKFSDKSGYLRHRRIHKEYKELQATCKEQVEILKKDDTFVLNLKDLEDNNKDEMIETGPIYQDGGDPIMVNDVDSEQDSTSNSHDIREASEDTTELDKMLSTFDMEFVPDNKKPLNKQRKTHSCEICGKYAFKKKSDYTKHLRVHTGERPYACDYCCKSFSDSSALLRHKRIHSGDKPYACPVCNKNFSCRGNMQKHVRSVHTDEKPFQCEVCEKWFSDTTDLRRHELIHTGENPYHCDICGKEFNARGNLRKHVLIHTGARPHNCVICQKRFRLRSHLKRHYESHLRKEAGIVPRDSKTSFNQAKVKQLITLAYGEKIGNQLSSLTRDNSYTKIKRLNDDNVDLFSNNDAEDGCPRLSEVIDNRLYSEVSKSPSVTENEKTQVNTRHIVNNGINGSSLTRKIEDEKDSSRLLNIESYAADDRHINTETTTKCSFRKISETLPITKDIQTIAEGNTLEENQDFNKKVANNLGSGLQSTLNKIDNVVLKLMKKFSQSSSTKVSETVDQVSSVVNGSASEGEVEEIETCANGVEDQCYQDDDISFEFKVKLPLEEFGSPYFDTAVVPDIYTCDICDKSFKGKSQLSRHKKVHASLQDGAEMFECDQCGKVFAQIYYLKKHAKRHSGEKPFKCSICLKEFGEKGYLERHFRTHTGEKPHSCEYCGKDFPERGSLARHRRIHTGEKPYKCEICGKMFSDISTYKRHTLIHGDPEDKPYICEVCNKKFSDASNLRRHIKIHLPEEWKEYQCELCFKTFRFKGELTRHSKTHEENNTEKAHKCDFCGKEFHERGGLVRHVRIHTGEKPYSCEECGKSFSDRSTYKRHTQIHDPYSKPNICEVCGKSFSDPSNLRRHKKAHTAEDFKEFQCDICWKSFRLKWELRRHHKIHKNLVSVDCVVCGQNFSSLKDVNDHISTEHESKIQEMRDLTTMYIKHEDLGRCMDDSSEETLLNSDNCRQEHSGSEYNESEIQIKQEQISEDDDVISDEICNNL